LNLLLTGLGTASAGEDPAPWLAQPKEAKYLGLQDRLAVVAAGRAAAGHTFCAEKTGLFLAVGHLPFDPADIARVLEASLDEQGQFSLPRFTQAGWTRARPLLAFKCLPNLAAYHVSQALGIAGPCSVGYPGPGQLHGALQDAADALLSGEIEVAVVGGVAAQRNWLVEHHHARLLPPVPPERLVDAAGFLVLTAGASSSLGRPALARLTEIGAEYSAHDPRERTPAWEESPGDGQIRGPAALPLALARHPLPLRHEVRGTDGVRCWSRWEAP
jgi:hypothetical protein